MAIYSPATSSITWIGAKYKVELLHTGWLSDWEENSFCKACVTAV